MVESIGKNNVGPVLSAGEIANAAIEAVFQDNPHREIIVENHVQYIRVETDAEYLIRRDTMKACLGRPFQKQELETIPTSFAGQIETSTDHRLFDLVKKL